MRFPCVAPVDGLVFEQAALRNSLWGWVPFGKHSLTLKQNRITSVNAFLCQRGALLPTVPYIHLREASVSDVVARER